MQNPCIKILPDSDALAAAFAAHFARRAAESVQARGRFLIALSGGGTPRKAYHLLAQSPFKENVPWDKIHFFMGDERYVPQDAPENNFHQVQDVLLSHVSCVDENLHPVPTHLPVETAVSAYAATLAAFAEADQMSARFDLVMLGLGSDGHTASLFPGQAARWTSPVIAAEGAYDGRPAKRISLTPLAINLAREVVFLVSGTAKAQALAATLASEDTNRYPAQAIRPLDGEVLWLVDRPASAEL